MSLIIVPFFWINMENSAEYNIIDHLGRETIGIIIE